MEFNHWDIIIFLPLLFAAWKGFRKGLIVELASIIGLIAGLYIAANFSEFAAAQLNEWFQIEGSWLSYLAFILTFIGVVFGVYAFAKVVEKAVNLVAMKLANKLAGALFGLIKMTLIISVVLNLLGWVDQRIPILQKSDPEKSLLFEVVLSAAPAVLPVLTDSEWLSSAEDWLSPLFDQSDVNSETE